MEAAALRNSVPPGRTAPFFGFVWTVVGAGRRGRRRVARRRCPRELSRLPLAFWLMAALAVAFDARPFSPRAERRSLAVFPSICFTFAIALELGARPGGRGAGRRGRRLRRGGWGTRLAHHFNIAQYACALAAADLVLRLVPGTGSVRRAAAPGRRGRGGRRRGGLARRQLRPGRQRRAAAVRRPVVATAPAGARLRAARHRLPAAARPGAGAAARASAALVPLMLLPLYAVYRMARLSGEREQLARLDPLTGLANRKALLAEVTAQVAVHAELAGKEARRRSSRCCCSTSTGSSTSTTRSGTRWATGCWSRSAQRLARGPPAGPGRPARRRRVRRSWRPGSTGVADGRASWPTGWSARWPSRCRWTGCRWTSAARSASRSTRSTAPTSPP